MKQQKRVIIDINICKIKELFVHLIFYTAFATYFNIFPREKCFFPVEIKCLGPTPFTGRHEMFNYLNFT